MLQISNSQSSAKQTHNLGSPQTYQNGQLANQSPPLLHLSSFMTTTSTTNPSQPPPAPPASVSTSTPTDTQNDPSSSSSSTEKQGPKDEENKKNKKKKDSLKYIRYDPAHENEYVASMRQLISKDLSEPYSIYVYRYFLYQWGDLCFMAVDNDDHDYDDHTTAENESDVKEDEGENKRKQKQRQQEKQKQNLVGVVVSKLEPHRGGPLRGYIAMLAVREEYRGRGIATKLVQMAIDAMIERDADEVGTSAFFLLLLFMQFDDDDS